MARIVNANCLSCGKKFTSVNAHITCGECDFKTDLRRSLKSVKARLDLCYSIDMFNVRDITRLSVAAEKWLKSEDGDG